MANSDTAAEIATMSFEQALAELEKIVTALEQGNVALEASIAHYERGEKLRDHCQRLLAAAEAKVDKIRTDSSGKAVGTEPLDRE